MPSTTRKRVYYFGDGKADGDGSMKDLLGGKGAGLAEMTNLGVPVPPGFTITTEVCTEFYSNGGKWPKGVAAEIDWGLKRLQKSMGRRFGDSRNPLLVSVRSGARVSMPGMMDTVLNLGLNDESVEGLARQSRNPRFAWDCYRRFIQMYGNVVLNIDSALFEDLLEKEKHRCRVKLDADLDAKALKRVATNYKNLVKRVYRAPFPQDPRAQLRKAMEAVFLSWHNPRAKEYRRIYGIPDHWGTAVNVQSMVFGNVGEDSGTGVAFSRDPSTGENRFYGEYLVNAQGEDVVAGIRTPQPLNARSPKNGTSLEEVMPDLYKQLVSIRNDLEAHYQDMLDMEFTIERGTLYMLQTRVGKRTGRAAVRIAVELARSRRIDKRTALMRVHPDQLEQLMHPSLDPQAKVETLTKGLPASPGAVSGHVVFSADDAVKWAKNGKEVILVRQETSPEDIHGMEASLGIITARGGMTSHAAVVGRGMGKSCVVGCSEMLVDHQKRQFSVNGKVVKEGDWVTIDGGSGRVVLGQVPTVDAQLDAFFETLMKWADKERKLGVRTNADTPSDAQRARNFGAEGIGLCRTEHMFFGEERLPIVQEMILNIHDDTIREDALKQLQSLQKKDFMGIFKAMDGLPVTVRLLDPPLHEFLPDRTEVAAEIAELTAQGKRTKRLKQLKSIQGKLSLLAESNPMLGHRGCRLGLTYPEIYEMQVRAIMQAACTLKKKGLDPRPEIMIPLVSAARELEILRERAVAVAEEVQKRAKTSVEYSIGTMIEVPRAALTAGEVARHADFFSFGTNDLTQMTYGFSRDDVNKFLPAYVARKVLPEDPFMRLDREGVGQLVELAVERGRGVKKKLKVGICGEHGVEESSVEFCHQTGLDYVSCSPFRVPVARLAAAQAAIRARKTTGRKASRRRGVKRRR